VKVLEATGADGSSKTVKITIWDTGKKLINSMAFYVRMWFLGFFLFGFFQLVKRGSAHSLALITVAHKASY
jgi:hypothetical protein